jgi:DNA-binding transcriptional LysR family regulator
MNLNRFVLFVTVAKYGSISKAASALHISQPSATQQLKALEAEYQIRLYRRAGKGVELTEEGRRFLKNVKALLKGVEDLKKGVTVAEQRRRPEPLTVGGNHGISSVFLPCLLAIFKREYPEVEITLRTDNSAAIARLIERGEADIGLIIDAPFSPTLVREPYRREKLIAFVPPGHPLAHKKRLNLTELGQTPLVIRGGAEYQNQIETILAHLESRGLEPTIGLRCDSPEAVKTAVAERMGVGILCRDLVEPQIRTGDFKKIELPDLGLEVQNFVVYSRERPLSAPARAFLKLLYRHRNHDYPLTRAA